MKILKINKLRFLGNRSNTNFIPKINSIIDNQNIIIDNQNSIINEMEKIIKRLSEEVEGIEKDKVPEIVKVIQKRFKKKINK